MLAFLVRMDCPRPVRWLYAALVGRPFLPLPSLCQLLPLLYLLALLVHLALLLLLALLELLELLVLLVPLGHASLEVPQVLGKLLDTHQGWCRCVFLSVVAVAEPGEAPPLAWGYLWGWGRRRGSLGPPDACFQASAGGRGGITRRRQHLEPGLAHGREHVPRRAPEAAARACRRAAAALPAVPRPSNTMAEPANDVDKAKRDRYLYVMALLVGQRGEADVLDPKQPAEIGRASCRERV